MGNYAHIGDMPAAIPAEKAILGALMTCEGAASTWEHVQRISETDFSLDSHRRVYRSTLTVRAAGLNVDLITVNNDLRNRKEIESVGGSGYLAFLSEDIPRNFNIESYVRIVKEKSLLRQLMSTFYDGQVRVSDQSEEPGELLRGMIAHLSGLAEDADAGDIPHVSAVLPNIELGSSAADALAEHLTVRDGIRFGFAELDEATGGAQKADLIIIAGRPSMGKTAMMTTVARHMAENEGASVAIFSMEQKKAAIVRRMLSAAARVDYQDIKSGVVRPHEQALLDERWHTLATSPLYIDDTPGLTVSRIRSKAQRLKRQLESQRRSLDVIFIDQLSKIKSEARHARLQKREQIGEITEALKALAQELDIPVILLVQIGREAIKRTDSRPGLGDLKDSGDIEEDADVVIFPHRTEYYDREDKTLEGKAELIIAKQREGPTKTCKVLYQGRIMRFEDEQPMAAKQDSFYEYQSYGNNYGSQYA